MDGTAEPGRLVASQYYGTIPLDFAVTGDLHACPYLPGQNAREEAFRAEDFPPELYHDFMDHEFRRAGLIFYRPVCDGCRECRPLRVLSREFRPSKSQRRVLAANHDIEVRMGLPKFTQEKYRIYADYLAMQHKTPGKDSPEDLRRFLYISPVQTLEFEYRIRGRLIAVSVADICSRSLSSVYAYYDPELSRRSLGTFSAMQEIHFCQERSIPFHYLGFFVALCPSMNYKAHFRPCEILSIESQWVRHDRSSATGTRGRS